jgi:hypothetical protein
MSTTSTETREVPRLKQRYRDEIVAAMQDCAMSSPWRSRRSAQPSPRTAYTGLSPTNGEPDGLSIPADVAG